MAFSINSIDKDGVVRVAAAGNLTWREVQNDGKSPLATLLGANWAQMRILLDMSQVGYIDSATVGWLIETQKAVKAAEGRLVIHDVQPAVQQVFDLLRVGRVIPMVRDESAAREKLAEPAV